MNDGEGVGIFLVVGAETQNSVKVGIKVGVIAVGVRVDVALGTRMGSRVVDDLVARSGR